ncbi:hypothetical protein MUP77_13640 [Candidatus Bathyarchaeota archaeon]|nr:hypothetical protein [Candidatus Bathyarchaeota archaeon]
MVIGYEWDTYEVDETFAKIAAREFADLKNGIPEWIKNSNDAYIRANRSKGERPIVVVYSANTKDYGVPAFACLDLVGMSTEDLAILKKWGDPTASGFGSGITGGHGNGGKSFATAGFNGPTIYYTLKNSIGNIYGFPDPPRPVTAWFPNGKDITVENPSGFLEEALSHIGLKLSALPEQVCKFLLNMSGFTLLIGHDPKDITGKFLTKWIDNLRNHKEMMLPLINCEIYIIANRRLLNNGKPLSLQDIIPMVKYAEPRVISIPSELEDPESGKIISPVGGGELSQGKLILRTMDRYIYQFHRIDYIQSDRIIGTKPVRDFVGQSYWTDHIFGSCTLACLTEEYVGNLRGPLVDRPLTRALNSWIENQIIIWAHEMEIAAAKERSIEVTEERKKRIIQQMESLNNLKDKLLDEMAGTIGSDEGGGGGRKPRHPPTALPDLPVALVRIASEGEVAGRLVELPLTVIFYDAEGREVKPAIVTWRSSNPSVARVDGSRGVIVTEHEGITEIWCETRDGITSNRIPIRVVNCVEIELVPPVVEVGIGRRTKIRAYGKLDGGEEVPEIRLFWQSSDTEIAIVGQHGMVTGITEGEASVSAREGDGTTQSVLVKVVPKVGGGKGPSRPKFLMSEIQTAWYETEPKKLTPDHPLVYQDAVDADNNVWWVNLKSPMADYIHNKHGELSEVWLVYLAERFADGLAEAALTSGPERGYESSPINNVLYDVAQRRKEFVKRFIEEYHKGGQITLG